MGVAVYGIIAMLFGKLSHISEYNTEEIENLIYVAQNCKLQVGNLLYSGILIASLGAVMDVAMSISRRYRKFMTEILRLAKRNYSNPEFMSEKI